MRIEERRGFWELNGRLLLKWSAQAFFGLFCFMLVLCLIVIKAKGFPFRIGEVVGGSLAMSAVLVLLIAANQPLRFRYYEHLMGRVDLDGNSGFTEVASEYRWKGRFEGTRRELHGMFRGIGFSIHYEFPRTQHDPTAGYQIELVTARELRDPDLFRRIHRGECDLTKIGNSGYRLRVLKGPALRSGRFRPGGILDEFVDGLVP